MILRYFLIVFLLTSLLNCSSTEKEINLLNIPVHIPAEKNRHVDNRGLLNINFMDSRIAVEKKPETLEQMFPESWVREIDKGPLFDAYTVRYKGESYFAFVMHSTGEKPEILFMLIGVGTYPKDLKKLLF